MWLDSYIKGLSRLSCASKYKSEYSGQNANVVLKIHSPMNYEFLLLKDNFKINFAFGYSKSK